MDVGRVWPLRDFDLILFSVSFEASYPQIIFDIASAGITLAMEKCFACVNPLCLLVALP